MGLGSFLGGSSGGGEMDKKKRQEEMWEYGGDVEKFQTGVEGIKGAAQQGIAGLGSRQGPSVMAPAGGFTPTYQGTGIEAAQQAQFRAQQAGLAQQLAAQAAGRGVSPAQIQAQQSLDQNMSALRSAAASTNSPHAGANLRSLGQSLNEANMRGSQDAAMLRARETQMAQQALGGVLSGARGQDIGLATGQAGLTQQAGLAGQQLQFQGGESDLDRQMRAQEITGEMSIRNQQQIDEMTKYYMNLGFDASTASLRAQQDLAQTYVGTHANAPAKAGFVDKAVGAGLTGLGVGLGSALSDKSAKENIDTEGASSDIRKFLDALKAYRYEYKDKYKDDPHAGHGSHYSVMAQDLVKSKVGRSFVDHRPDGLMQVNYGKGLAAILAAQADINSRLKMIEG